jgi:predicted XRE-type DNA-binding protein
MPYGPKRLGLIQVQEIRQLYDAGEYTQKQLADIYKVSQPLVCKIINNQVHKPEIHFGGEAVVRAGYIHAN